MESFVFATTLNVVTGCVFKEMRTRLKIEQSVIATALSIPVSTISKIESGAMNLTVEYIFMLCSFYNMKASYFFEIVEKCIEYLQVDKKVFVYNDKAVKKQIGDKVSINIPSENVGVLSTLRAGSLGISVGVGLGAAALSVGIIPVPLAILGIGVVHGLLKNSSKEETILEKEQNTATIELTTLPPKTIATSLEEVFAELDFQINNLFSSETNVTSLTLNSENKDIKTGNSKEISD